MRIRVLGSAAGGGFPQWNCGCPNCRGVREAVIAATPRTQESVAVSADGEAWFLLNASPEIRQQIESFPPLHPRRPRHSPIQGIVLTNGDLDHCLGLLSLRESHPLVVYATERVRRGFTEGNVLYRTLQRFSEQVTWRDLKPGREDALLRQDGAPSGLALEAVALPGKLPIHLEGQAPPDPEDNIGLRLREVRTGRVLAYLPAVAAVTGAVREALEGADCVFFDGTFWSSDELPALALGPKRAEEMAHLPVGGPGGSLEALAGLGASRRILIHVNNTNPLLRDDSPERAAARARGWEVARDGMDIDL
ncbi:MAG: pyrroloquinoline quinone biosynthesis protein PqqB [Candidatus Rokubacteria bacterium]|nr:pyrroloquinoline quinone biosynthesis protein PqqB [Candidatus Rokubacteria bacterium]